MTTDQIRFVHQLFHHRLYSLVVLSTYQKNLIAGLFHTSPSTAEIFPAPSFYTNRPLLKTMIAGTWYISQRHQKRSMNPWDVLGSFNVATSIDWSRLEAYDVVLVLKPWRLTIDIISPDRQSFVIIAVDSCSFSYFDLHNISDGYRIRTGDLIDLKNAFHAGIVPFARIIFYRVPTACRFIYNCFHSNANLHERQAAASNHGNLLNTVRRSNISSTRRPSAAITNGRNRSSYLL